MGSCLVELRMNGERENSLPVIMKKERKKENGSEESSPFLYIFHLHVYVAFRLHFAGEYGVFLQLGPPLGLNTSHFHTLYNGLLIIHCSLISLTSQIMYCVYYNSITKMKF